MNGSYWYADVGLHDIANVASNAWCATLPRGSGRVSCWLRSSASPTSSVRMGAAAATVASPSITRFIRSPIIQLRPKLTITTS